MGPRYSKIYKKSFRVGGISQGKDMIMSKEVMKFGIVGCGVISQIHAEAICSIPNAELIAVCDIDIQVAKSLADKYNVEKIYTNYDRMLQEAPLNIVNVCTPSGLHAKQTIAAARYKKHVIVEKPMALNLDDADEMIKVCKKMGVKLSCIFNNRFHKTNQKIRKAIDESKFGKLFLGNALARFYRTQAYYDKGGWRGTWAMDGGGSLINQSIHTIDLLRWFMGPVDRVFGFTATVAHNIEAEDVGVAAIKFKSGALGTIIGSTSCYPGSAEETVAMYASFPPQIEIFGENGTAIVEETRIRKWLFKKEKEEKKIIDSAIDIKGLHLKPEQFYLHRAQIVDVMKAIKEEREPVVNGEEGRKALELIRGIYLSAKTGKAIHFPIQEKTSTG